MGQLNHVAPGGVAPSEIIIIITPNCESFQPLDHQKGEEEAALHFKNNHLLCRRIRLCAKWRRNSEVLRDLWASGGFHFKGSPRYKEEEWICEISFLDSGLLFAANAEIWLCANDG